MLPVFEFPSLESAMTFLCSHWDRLLAPAKPQLDPNRGLDCFFTCQLQVGLGSQIFCYNFNLLLKPNCLCHLFVLPEITFLRTFRVCPSLPKKEQEVDPWAADEVEWHGNAKREKGKKAGKI